MHSAKDQLLNTLKKYITRKNDILYFEVIMFLCAFWFKQNRLYVNSMTNLKLKISTPKCGNKSRKECPTLGNILFFIIVSISNKKYEEKICLPAENLNVGVFF